MILDDRLEFADDVSVAAAAGTAIIGDVVDLGSTSSDIGNGQPMYLVVLTGSEEIITGGAAGTLEIRLVSSASATITSTPTLHLTSGALVTDDDALNDSRFNIGGQILIAALPHGTYLRYMGILAVTATTTTTAGKIHAFLTHDVSKWTASADGLA